MSITKEVEKVRDVIRSVEDPSTATALRHLCKALEEMERELREGEENRPPMGPQ